MTRLVVLIGDAVVGRGDMRPEILQQTCQVLQPMINEINLSLAEQSSSCQEIQRPPKVGKE